MWDHSRAKGPSTRKACFWAIAASWTISQTPTQAIKAAIVEYDVPPNECGRLMT
jgi:hypothetical protein